MAATVNTKKAQQVLRRVEQRYRCMLAEPGVEGPQLRTYRHEGLSRGSWSIDWDEGPEGWALALSERVRVLGVFLEPIRSNTLGIHPDWEG